MDIFMKRLASPVSVKSLFTAAHSTMMIPAMHVPHFQAAFGKSRLGAAGESGFVHCMRLLVQSVFRHFD